MNFCKYTSRAKKYTSAILTLCASTKRLGLGQNHQGDLILPKVYLAKRVVLVIFAH